MQNKKSHAAVAKSTFGGENVQNMSASSSTQEKNDVRSSILWQKKLQKARRCFRLVDFIHFEAEVFLYTMRKLDSEFYITVSPFDSFVIASS